MAKKKNTTSVLGTLPPSRSIIKLAVPATLALLAKAVYNIVDTAYIGMLNSDIALTAVGVTLPLLLIMVSIENILPPAQPFWPDASWGPKIMRKLAAPSAPL